MKNGANFSRMINNLFSFHNPLRDLERDAERVVSGKLDRDRRSSMWNFSAERIRSRNRTKPFL